MSTAQAIVGIKKWGNNLGVRLPNGVARAAHLQAEQMVCVSVSADGNSITIAPVAAAPLTLEQRLAQFDPERHGAEAMASKALGAEAW